MTGEKSPQKSFSGQMKSSFALHNSFAHIRPRKEPANGMDIALIVGLVAAVIGTVSAALYIVERIEHYYKRKK